MLADNAVNRKSAQIVEKQDDSFTKLLGLPMGSKSKGS